MKIIKSIAVILGLALALLFMNTIRLALDPEVQYRAQLEAQRQQALDDRLTWLDTAVTGLWRVAPLGVLVFVGALLWRRYGERPAVHADKVIQLTRAQHPALPKHLQTYNLHEAPRALPSAPCAPQLPEATQALALPGVLDLATLHLHPTKERILLAVDERGPITVALHDLLHCALLGSTGGGKSNLLRLILPQLQAVGAKVALADPHYAPVDPENGDDWRPIAARLAFRPAVKAGEIDELLAYFMEELVRRLEKRNKGEKWGPALFLAFDELPVITDLVPDAPARLGKLLREGRKVGLLTCGASQSMLIKEVGGSSALRDQYRTAFYVGGDRKSASAMLDLPERLIDDGPLGQGVVLLRSKVTSPAQLVRVPYVSNDALYQLLDPTSHGTSHGTSPAASWDDADAPREVGGEVTREVGGGEVLLPASAAENARSARVRDLLREKRSQNDIIASIWGVSGGKAYQQATEEYRAIVAQLVGGA